MHGSRHMQQRIKYGVHRDLAHCVNNWQTHIQQVDAFGVQDPLVLILVDAVLVQVGGLQLTHEDLADPRNALQLYLRHATHQRYCPIATVSELPGNVRHILLDNALCYYPIVAEAHLRCHNSQPSSLRAGVHVNRYAIEIGHVTWVSKCDSIFLRKTSSPCSCCPVASLPPSSPSIRICKHYPFAALHKRTHSSQHI